MKLSLTLSLVLIAAACGGKSVPPAPQPFRPDVVEVDRPPDPKPKNADCAEATELQVTPFDNREIPAAQSLAKQGDEKLVAAKAAGSGTTYEEAIGQAADRYLEALSFDPYNVEATYSLAGVYALIERPTCSLNLLQRLVYMRHHASKKAAVEKRLDLLLGRNAKGEPDETFRILWGDGRWQKLIDSICEKEEATCVYGK